LPSGISVEQPGLLFAPPRSSICDTHIHDGLPVSDAHRALECVI
jgi:hypothetical protein